MTAADELVGSERPAHRRAHADGAEELLRHGRRVQHFGFAPGGVVETPGLDRRDRLERSQLLAPVQEIGRRHVVADGGISRRSLPEHDDAIRLAIRKRPHEQRVDYAEDSDRAADAKRQHEDCERRESWTAAEEPEPMTRVLHKREVAKHVHLVPRPSSFNASRAAPCCVGRQCVGSRFLPSKSDDVSVANGRTDGARRGWRIVYQISPFKRLPAPSSFRLQAEECLARSFRLYS
jgi:hypothetical protein